VTRWYVVAVDYRDDLTEDDAVWTLSRDPDTTGWETDGGTSGYGLTFADAKELADAANAKDNS
jgi:hypothetical protein